MLKQDIIAKLQQNDSTLLSFPDRNNEWGDGKYRGNCSGWIHAFCIWKYKVKKLAELFAGSGTGSDVARDMNISYIGADLNPNAVRPDILSVNAITDEVPDEFRDADFLFQHPPYSNLINISWADKAWIDTTGRNLKAQDLGNMDWERFMNTLNHIIMKYYSAMAPGARMGILMGDVRRNGLHSMLADIVRPGQLEQIIIKQQHNCVSNGNVYANRNFVPIAHEYLMILKKVNPYMLDFILPQRTTLDIRDAKQSTWKDVIMAYAREVRVFTNVQIENDLKKHEKGKRTKDIAATLRRECQELARKGLLHHTGWGKWCVAA